MYKKGQSEKQKVKEKSESVCNLHFFHWTKNAQKKEEEKELIMWYDKFGGRKAYQVFWASILGLIAFILLPVADRVTVIYYFLGYWATCFGVFGFYNIQEHKINGGDRNGKQ